MNPQAAGCTIDMHASLTLVWTHPALFNTILHGLLQLKVVATSPSTGTKQCHALTSVSEGLWTLDVSQLIDRIIQAISRSLNLVMLKERLLLHDFMQCSMCPTSWCAGNIMLVCVCVRARVCVQYTFVQEIISFTLLGFYMHSTFTCTVCLQPCVFLVNQIPSSHHPLIWSY